MPGYSCVVGRNKSANDKRTSFHHFPSEPERELVGLKHLRSQRTSYMAIRAYGLIPVTRGHRFHTSAKQPPF